MMPAEEDRREAQLYSRARARLRQLREGGLGLDILERDQVGPTRVRRRVVVDTTWRRVSGVHDTFELEDE